MIFLTQFLAINKNKKRIHQNLRLLYIRKCEKCHVKNIIIFLKLSLSLYEYSMFRAILEKLAILILSSTFEVLYRFCSILYPLNLNLKARFPISRSEKWYHRLSLSLSLSFAELNRIKVSSFSSLSRKKSSKRSSFDLNPLRYYLSDPFSTPVSKIIGVFTRPGQSWLIARFIVFGWLEVSLFPLPRNGIYSAFPSGLVWVGTQWVITLSSGVGKKIVIDGFVDNSNRCCSNLIVNRDNLYVHNVISN